MFFKEPKLIIENTVNVTKHIRNKLNNSKILNSKETVLTLIENINGEPFYIFDNNYWCLLILSITRILWIMWIPNSKRITAKAYGKFQKYLSDFNVDKCHITIEGFHNLSNRIKYLENVIQKDPKKRLEYKNRKLNN